MPTKATVVIGAGFGDEGKGHLVDYFAAQSKNSIVARFNGGAQAAHTVHTPDDEQFVFHHFGSGTLSGSATFLSKHFIVNPFLWCKERDELLKLNIQNDEDLPVLPKVHIDADAMLTLPYDMMLNQEIERHRGENRHGSCGVGINETVVRCQSAVGKTHARDMVLARLDERIKFTRDLWVPQRMQFLGIPMTDEFKDRLHDDSIIQHFKKACAEMTHSAKATTAWTDTNPFKNYSKVIFEGAQGLLLDENHEYFPHVTRSKTGLDNVIEVALSKGITSLDVVYATRSYMTRHGAGPFVTEDPDMNFVDTTNKPNEFQGSLRFGRLDLKQMKKAILSDLEKANRDIIKINPCLAVNCLDQTNGQVLTSHGTATGIEEINQMSMQVFGIPFRYMSYGTRRDKIVDLKKGSVFNAFTAA